MSVRDAAASEYPYGPMPPEQESLEGAFAMFAFGMGSAEIGDERLVEVGGMEILTADVLNGENAGLMAVRVLDDSYASVYAESPTDSLPAEAVDSILQVLASISL